MYWVIDGYNLMRQSPQMSSLEIQDAKKGKKALINFLNTFSELTSEKVRVYFDLYSQMGSSLLEERDGLVDLVYSRGSYTADEEILLHLKQKAPHVFCVSSDREIQQGAKALGVSFLNSQDFEHWVWKIIDAVDGIRESSYQKRGSSYSPPKEKKKAWSRMRRLYETM